MLVSGEAAPGSGDALLALAAGTAGITALGLFYRALAIGTMSIVAPISASGAALPVVVGIATGDRLTTIVAAGLAVTMVGVLLAAREQHEDHVASRASIVLALGAALGFGTFFVLYDAASDASVVWAVMLARVMALPLVGGAVLVQRPAMPRGRDLWMLCGAGCVDLAATGLYALANREGELSVVAVVGSLYPVATVLLARAVLTERVRRAQAVGVVAAFVGVALVTAGSGG